MLEMPYLLWRKPWTNFDAVYGGVTGTDKICESIRVIDCELGHHATQCVDILQQQKTLLLLYQREAVNGFHGNKHRRI